MEKTEMATMNFIDPNLMWPIGLGGLVGGELITFDYAEGNRLKPYVCKILGRDYTYGFKREFVSSNRFVHSDQVHGKRVHLISFPLEPFYIYEYKRFIGTSVGEIEEGYIGLWGNDFVLLEREEVETMCGSFRERAIKDAKSGHRPKQSVNTPPPEKVDLKPKSDVPDARNSKKDKEEEKKKAKLNQLEFNFAPDDIPF